MFLDTMISVPIPLRDLTFSLGQALRPKIDILSDEWDVLDWVKRPGNLASLTLRFTRIRNVDLRVLAKIYVAARRVQIGISSAGAFGILAALVKLDSVIGDKTIDALNFLDFIAVENAYLARGVTGKVTTLSNLQTFSKWLQMRVGLRILYQAPKGGPNYGRHGSEDGRHEKLLPTEILRDLVGLVSNPELPLRDKFFINALVINIALGCRVNELACLPLDCLVEMQGKWVFKVFPEKGGEILYRPFPQEMYPAVKAAVDFIVTFTAEGRNIVKTLRSTPGLDWRKILRTEKSLKYFSQKFASEWTQQHNLFTPNGCYNYRARQFVDAIGLLRRFKNPSDAAAYLGTPIRMFKKLYDSQVAMSQKIFLYEKRRDVFAPLTFDVENWQAKLWRHPHAISFVVMERHYGMTAPASGAMRNIVSLVVKEALSCQLQGQVYPFEPDSAYEKNFHYSILPTVRAGSKIFLEPENSLFVIPRNVLTYSDAVRSDQFRKVSSTIFDQWLSGASGRDDSLFKRFNIIDPRTGTVARFTWHDVRHWLNTTYKQGGLSDAQVNVILGRTDYAQAQVYDHTPALSRSLILQEMMDRVKDDRTVGLIQTTFNKLKISDRKTAEEYLKSAIRVINPMPHGGCAHNLALKPCHNHLSCVAKGTDGKPCEMLVVDSENKQQRAEIQKIANDASLIKVHIVNAGGESSPQFRHYECVEESANYILAEIFKKNDG